MCCTSLLKALTHNRYVDLELFFSISEGFVEQSYDFSYHTRDEETVMDSVTSDNIPAPRPKF